ncbi:hypothetical protein [Neisseria elongata]|nr:hypothetical protein [Neisseria elongata]
MSTIPLSKLSKGAVAHIDSIVAKPKKRDCSSGCGKCGGCG